MIKRKILSEYRGETTKKEGVYMRRLASWLIVIFLAIGLWGAGAFAADWTFMVYLDGDNNLEGFGIDDFLEMSAVGSDANVNIIVQFDRIDGYDSSYGDWTSCKRFKVTSGMTPSASSAVEDIGEANMGDPATLTDFINWGTTNYPANHYAVILWDHGSGWREQQEALMKALEMAKTGQEREEIRRALMEIRRPTYKAVCFDDTNADRLYMKEVQSAFNAATLDTDLIGFDACLMGMVEVAYEIKDTGASVMVGSEETEPGDGWPYDTILTDLTSNSSWTPTQLGTAIVDRYYESYGNSETQAAIDLGHMDTLGSTVSDFANTMMNFWDTNQPAVQAAAQSVMDEVDTAVIHEHHGSSWPGSHGLAIYFPATLGEFDPDYNGTIIDFPADTLWEEFLSDFYASMGGSWIQIARSASQEYYTVEHIDLYDFCYNIVNVPVCDTFEGFEAGVMPPDGWELISTHAGDETWYINDYNPHSGTYFASCLYDPYLIPQDEVLISPECNNPQSLTFWSFGSLYWGGGDPYDNYDVEIWLVKGDWDAGTVDDIYIGKADDDWVASFVWAESTFDLSSSTGTYRIGFRYTGVDGAQAALDDICIACGGDDDCVEDDTGSLDIAGSSGGPGGTTAVRARIQGAPNSVGALGFDVVFDPTLMTYMGFERGALVQDFDFFECTIPTGEDNIVRCGGFKATGGIASGASGDVVILDFDVMQCVQGDMYPLDLQELKDDISTWSSSHGCFQCGCSCDINGDGEITPQDALCAFQKYLGICPTACGPCDDICCDVTMDGDCTPADALEIFREYLGIRPNACSPE
jgi:hypothetical protein